MATNGTLPRTRVNWVDVAKFISIVLIFGYHLTAYHSATKVFIENSSIQCFFLLSGCMANYDKSKNFLKFTLKKVRTLLVPMFAFGVLSIINQCAICADFAPAGDMFVQLILGCIRNRFFAMQLWFLSCLFVIEIVFKLITYLKDKRIILAVTVAVFAAAYIIIEPKAIATPHLPYNIDSALYYIIYYAVGYVYYPYIEKLFADDTKVKNPIFYSAAFTCALFCICAFYFEIPMPNIAVIRCIYPVFRSLAAVWLILCAAKFLEKVGLFVSCGRETLWVCGNEYAVKLTVLTVFEACGIKRLAYNTVLSYSIGANLVIAFIFVVFTAKAVVPAEKYLVGLVKKLIGIKSK